MTQPIRELSDVERLSWLRLSLSENIGPVSFFRLLQRFGSAAAALAALPDLARRGGKQTPLRLASKADAEREWAAATKLGARMVGWCEPDYPALLRQIADPPPFLYVRGHPQLLQKPMVAMVGARNASLTGRNLAQKLAAELGQAGWVVVSGLARGIDTAAHGGALEHGTVAVVAGGADIIYPPENRALHGEIIARGTLLAESPVGTQPHTGLFPRRNRIISGLCRGLVVVEATANSGSLITARQAAEQNREVMAVPGSPADPRAEGCNKLIKDGAFLVENGRDILNILQAAGSVSLGEPAQRDLFMVPQTGDSDSAPVDQQMVDAARAALLDSLSASPVLVDEAIRDCQLSAAIGRAALLELELAGLVTYEPGGRIRRLDRK